MSKRKPRKLPHVLTLEDQAQVIAQIGDSGDSSSVRNRAIIRIMLDTGLRASELINLKVQDISLEDGRLWVRSGKGGKDRGLWFNGETRATLARWLALKPSSGDHIFTDLREGKPLCGRWLRKYLARLGVKAGLTFPLHPHTLRHCFATDLLRDTKNLFLVSKALGHANIGTTQIYLHLTDQEMEDAMKNFRGG